jgi:hypothetical protein
LANWLFFLVANSVKLILLDLFCLYVAN